MSAEVAYRGQLILRQREDERQYERLAKLDDILRKRGHHGAMESRFVEEGGAVG